MIRGTPEVKVTRANLELETTHGWYQTRITVVLWVETGDEVMETVTGLAAQANLETQSSHLETGRVKLQFLLWY